jgi:3-deoxy-D-arabino-heptulosonate 7-phosphate (DAHP) synthase
LDFLFSFMLKIEGQEHTNLRGLMNPNSHILIAGPCEYEGHQMFKTTAEHMAKYGDLVRIISAPFREPTVLPHALETAQKCNLIYATEVETRGDVMAISRALREVGGNQTVMVWNGARNTSPGVIKDNARAIMGDLPEETVYMLENPNDWDEEVWRGLLGHLDAVGFPRDKIIWCHRGVSVKGMQRNIQGVLNPQGFRNVPLDIQALQIANETGIPIIRDDSHIYGPPDKIIGLAEGYLTLPYHGHMIEVNCNGPDERKSDVGQQLSLEQFDHWLELYVQAVSQNRPIDPNWFTYTSSW